MKKYILSVVLALGVLVAPASTLAASLTNTQVQAILTLLSAFGADSATIAGVKSVLAGTSTGGGGGGKFCYNFNKDLTVGSSGSGVSALNQVFAYLGIDTSAVTSDRADFDENTAALVVQFQAKYGIKQTGYVGPLTRAKLNSLYGCSAQEPTSSGGSGGSSASSPATSSTTYSTSATPLSAAKYSGYGDQTVVAGATNVRLGSFTLTAGAKEGVNVNTITVSLSNASSVTDLLLRDASTGSQIGTTRVTPSGTGNSFSTISLTIPAASSKTIDIYGNVKANSVGTIQASVQATGAGIVTGNAATSATTALQTITIGNGSLLVSRSSSEPTSRNIMMGDSSVPVGQFTFRALSSSYTIQHISILVPSAIGASMNSITAITIRYRDANGLIQTATSPLVLGANPPRTTFVGLSMYVPANGSANLDVMISTATVATGGNPGTAVNVVLSGSPSGSFAAVNNSSGTISYQINDGTDITAGGTFTLVTDTQTTSTTSAPTITFLGTPTLTLQYDSAGKESQLVGKAIVKVTTGSSSVNPNTLPSILWLANTSLNPNGGFSSWSNSSSRKVEGLTGDIIPANNSQVFTISLTAPTRELFAGTYILGLTTLNDPAGNWSVQPAAFKDVYVNSNSLISGTNSVTIIGETSPYIESVWSDLAGNATLRGSRFGSSGSSVAISMNGKTVSSGTSGYYTSVRSASGSDSVNFKPADFGITTSGNYQVQIINSSVGNSNVVWLNYTAPTPVATVLGDVNNNGSVDVGDAMFISQYVAGSRTLTTAQLTVADVNGDGKVTTSDATIISNYLAKKVGDVDGNGSISSGDALMVSTYVAGTRTLTSLQKAAADMNADGKITQADADAILTRSVTAPVSLGGGTGQVAGAFSALENLSANSSAAQAPAIFTYTWSHDLQIGSPYTADVQALQTALAREGVYTGEATGGFYSQTFAAVKAFQQKYGIDATGYVGPATRAKLNALY